MPCLTSITMTQEFEIDLIELAYNHVDSVDDLKKLLEGISSHTVEAYKEELAGKIKEEIYDSINDVGDLTRFIDNIGDTITDEYRQKFIEEENNKQPTDLLDAICSANEDELQDALICLLNQHPRSLHRFMVNKQPEIKLALIESSQALMLAFDKAM